MKNISIPHICIGVCVGLTVFTFQCSNENYRLHNENQRLKITNDIYLAEHRILKDEIAEHEKKPTYEQGCKDTLIKMGANGTEGWNNGYDAAVSLLANTSYAEGYHSAIQQFGYQKPDTSRYLSPEPKKDKTNKPAEVTTVGMK